MYFATYLETYTLYIKTPTLKATFYIINNFYLFRNKLALKLKIYFLYMHITSLPFPCQKCHPFSLIYQDF